MEIRQSVRLPGLRARSPTSYSEAAARLARLGKGEVRNEPVPDQPDRSFDLLAAFEVLEHIEDDRGTLSNWARHGHLADTSYQRPCPSRPFRARR